MNFINFSKNRTRTNKLLRLWLLAVQKTAAMTKRKKAASSFVPVAEAKSRGRGGTPLPGATRRVNAINARRCGKLWTERRNLASLNSLAVAITSSLEEFGRAIRVDVSNVSLKCRLKSEQATSTSCEGSASRRIAISVVGAGAKAVARYSKKCPSIAIDADHNLPYVIQACARMSISYLCYQAFVVLC